MPKFVIRPKIPQCPKDPHAEIVRKRINGTDVAICAECNEWVGFYCMSQQNDDICQFLRHTTASHTSANGYTWVDSDIQNAEVEVALGDDDVETEILD